MKRNGKKVAGVANLDVDVETTNLDKFHFINKTSELDDLLEEYKEKDDWEAVVILDEGDQLFGGFGTSQIAARELGDRVKLFRKAGAHILMTSQRQVAPDLRNRFHLRYKPSVSNEDRLVAAKQLDSEGRPADGTILFKTEGVPETNVDYNTLAEGSWQHDVDDDGNDEAEERVQKAQEKAEQKDRQMNKMLLDLYESTDMSYEQIGKKVGLSKSTVYDRVQKAKEY